MVPWRTPKTGNQYNDPDTHWFHQQEEKLPVTLSRSAGGRRGNEENVNATTHTHTHPKKQKRERTAGVSRTLFPLMRMASQ